MAKSIIQIKNVSKYFGLVQAINDINLSIEAGTIHGLLGPNGAGKTTLIRLLATLIPPTAGILRVAGYDVVKQSNQVRSMIGLAGQYAAVDDFMTGRETLEMVGNLYHLPKIDIKRRANELSEQLGLGEFIDRPAKTYSGGMRRRLDLGASLMFRPKVIFLDEPTTGLDPRTRLELWDIIKSLARDGSTVLLTTQYLEEADALASNITIIDKGKIVAQGTARKLKNSLGADIIEIYFPRHLRIRGRTIIESLGIAASVVEDDLTGAFRFPAKQGSKTLLTIAKTLHEAGIAPEEISLHRPSLDDVFLAVTDSKNKL